VCIIPIKLYVDVSAAIDWLTIRIPAVDAVLQLFTFQYLNQTNIHNTHNAIRTNNHILGTLYQTKYVTLIVIAIFYLK